MSEQGRLAASQIAANDMMTGKMVAGTGAVQAQGDNAFAQGISGAMDAVGQGGMQYTSYKMLEPFLAKLGGENKDNTRVDTGAHQEDIDRSIVVNTPMPRTTFVSNWDNLPEIPTDEAWSSHF